MATFFQRNTSYVLLIDKDEQFRKHLETFLVNKKIIIVGSFDDDESIAGQQLSAVPNLAILEFKNDIDRTAAAVRRLKEVFHAIKIIINSSINDGLSINNTLEIEANALIYKGISGGDSILRAIKAVIEGRSFLSRPQTLYKSAHGEFNELLKP